MQGVGFLTVPVTTCILLITLGTHSTITWRILLGLGCLPGLVLAVLRSTDVTNKTKTTGPSDVQDTPSSSSSSSLSLVQALQTEPKLFRKLLGTAGTWFVFDICFYGNTLFQPYVLTDAFGPKTTLLLSARDTAIVAAIALPGYFVSVYMLGRQSPRYIQLQGFLCMAVLYTIIGIDFHGLARFNKWVMMVLYALTFFFANYGPNATVRMYRLYCCLFVVVCCW